MTPDRLAVWLEPFPEPIGFLSRSDSGALSFRYDDVYHDRQSAIPLSLSLPIHRNGFDDSLTRAFFDNLLQENAQLHVILDREGLARDDLLGIFYHIGADCPGAISCLAEDSGPLKIPGDLTQDYDSLSQEDLHEIVRALADNKPLPDGLADPSPVAGVQNKIALTVMPDCSYAIPKSGRKVPTTHILKIPRRGDGREAKLEAKATQMAHDCGLAASSSDAIRLGDIDGLLIKRFDRRIKEGKVSRIHQEDFAQALGLPARLKYERTGTGARTFNAAAIKSILDQTQNPALSLRSFLVITFFNLAIGNNDNHAKNHALLYSPGMPPSLAPYYDLLPILLNGRVSHELAFNIGSADHADKISKDDYYHFFSSMGLTKTATTRFLRTEIVKLFQQIDLTAQSLKDHGMKDFDDLIGREMTSIAETLGLDISLRDRDYYTTQAGGWGSLS